MLFRIAAGGMAEVYVARLVGEGGFEKLVALKRMLPTLAEDERFVGMFLDEGRVAANISSPHVVSTLDLGRAEDDSLYLVMELVVGVSLSALLRVLTRAKFEVPVELAAEIIAQAALGLHDAHEARTLYGEPLGIVHRDISPQNVLVDVSGRVRITDFGVARAVERVTQTQSGEVKGKLGYFAPEQARAKPIDRRADVYALGIVAWELLTGRRLFAGDGPAETLMRVLEMEVPRVDTVRPEVPAALADAIAHALERDVEKRTATAGELAQAIRLAVPSPGPAPLGKLVRERGGESLLRLEEGIRAQMPSSPSARVSSIPKQPVTPEEELTTRTPSAISRVVEKSGTGSKPVVPLEATAAPLAPPSPEPPIVEPVSRASFDAAPAIAPAPSRPAWLVPAIVAAVIVVLGGVGFALTRQPEVTASSLEVPTSVPVASVPVVVAPVVPEAPVVADEVVAPVDVAPADVADEGLDQAADTAPATSARRPRVRRPPPRTEGAPPERSGPRRPDALRGMDDFEAELGN
jgi:serine/threonine protein kinase